MSSSAATTRVRAAIAETSASVMARGSAAIPSMIFAATTRKWSRPSGETSAYAATTCSGRSLPSPDGATIMPS